jgi:hypothetical protein
VISMSTSATRRDRTVRKDSYLMGNSMRISSVQSWRKLIASTRRMSKIWSGLG